MNRPYSINQQYHNQQIPQSMMRLNVDERMLMNQSSQAIKMSDRQKSNYKRGIIPTQASESIQRDGRNIVSPVSNLHFYQKYIQCESNKIGRMQSNYNWGRQQQQCGNNNNNNANNQFFIEGYKNHSHSHQVLSTQQQRMIRNSNNIQLSRHELNGISNNKQIPNRDFPYYQSQLHHYHPYQYHHRNKQMHMMRSNSMRQSDDRVYDYYYKERNNHNIAIDDSYQIMHLQQLQQQQQQQLYQRSSFSNNNNSCQYLDYGGSQQYGIDRRQQYYHQNYQNNYNNLPSSTYTQCQQHSVNMVHYQKQQHQYYQQQHAQQQKSTVQLLIEQIHQINIQISYYLQQKRDHTNQNSYGNNFNEDNLNSSQVEQLKQLLLEKIRMIQQLIQSNYKLFEQTNQSQLPQDHYNNNNINNNHKLININTKHNQSPYYHYFINKISHLHNNNNQQPLLKQQKTINFNRIQIIDYKQPFLLFNQISKHYLGDNNNKQKYINNNNNYNNQNKYSGQYCVNVFIQLIIEINQFYTLKYQLNRKIKQQQDLLYEQQTHHINDINRISRRSQLQKQRESFLNLPQLLTSILWHIQTLRVLTCSYQHQLRHTISNMNISNINDNIPNYNHGNKKQSTNNPTLDNLSSQCIKVIDKVQQLMGVFLQQIMLLSTQQQQQKQQISIRNNTFFSINNSNKKDNHQKVYQTLQFFYYQYPIFNQQWILLLLDTLLRYQMVLGVGYQQIVQSITKMEMNKNINDRNQRLLQQGNNYEQTINRDKNSNTRVNKTSKKLINNNNNFNNYNSNNNSKSKSNNKHTLQQSINNILSILSFLLFPHQQLYNNPQSSHTHHIICQLLQQPIKQLIVKQMKHYQSQIQRYQNNKDNDDMTVQDRKCFLIQKFLLVDKITNLVSFFTTKLSESKSKTKSQQYKCEQKRKQKRRQKKYKRTESNHNDQVDYLTNLPLQLNHYDQEVYFNTINQSFNNHDNHQDNIQVTNNRFEIQLKIMQMTLFVRQMCDILILDQVKTLQLTDDKQNSLFNLVNMCLSKLSIQQMIGMLFEKVLRRKKLTNNN